MISKFVRFADTTIILYSFFFIILAAAPPFVIFGSNFLGPVLKFYTICDIMENAAVYLHNFYFVWRVSHEPHYINDR